MSKVYPRKCNFYQKQFDRHFNSEGHNEIEDSKIAIIDRVEDVSELRCTVSYCQHRFDNFIFNWLSERSVGVPKL